MKQDWKDEKWSESESRFLKLLEKRNKVLILFDQMDFSSQLKILEEDLVK